MKSWSSIFSWPMAVLLVLVCCAHPQPVPPSATCEDACANLTNLHCPAAQATLKGVSCVEVCRHVAPALEWNLPCRSVAASCDAIDACEVPR